MSYLVREKLAGRSIRVVYDAALISLPAAAGGRRLARSMQAMRHMKHHRSKAALFRRVGVGAEHWWAASHSGHLLAAGIMHWVHSAPEDASDEGFIERPTDFRVLVPLDQRVYVCRIADREIRMESVLPPEQALEHVPDFSSGREIPTFAWQFSDQAAGTAEAVAEVVPLEKAPFELKDVKLAPLWLAFARNRMIHRSHLVFGGLAGMALSMILLAGPVLDAARRADFGDRPWQGLVEMVRSLFGEEVVEIPETPEIVRVVPEVPHDPDAQLIRFAEHLAGVRLLHPDGVRRVEYQAGTVLITGQHSPPRYPYRARAHAAEHGGEFTVSPTGWTIRLPSDMPPPGIRPPEIHAADLVEFLIQVPRLDWTEGMSEVPGRMNIETSTYQLPMIRTGWSASLDQAPIGEMHLLSHRLRDLPLAVTLSVCGLEGWRIRSCTIHFEGLSL